MGCVSSKIFRNDLKREITINNGGDYPNHVVSLTSSTYGVLKLESEKTDKESAAESEGPEVINAWELMEGLEEEVNTLNRPKKSPNTRLFLRGFGDVNPRTPLKFLNQIGSPRKGKRSGGKENRGGGIVRGLFGYSPKETPKSNKITENSRDDGLNLSFSVKGSPVCRKRESFGNNHSEFSFRRRSLSPLFDPELVASYERELSEEGEQIKRMILETPKSRRASPKFSVDSSSFLQTFEGKCPPGGESSVVIYTTTLRGIRKTFEDCNIVRTIIESHNIQMFERDVSMDSGFKEELRALMSTKEVRVPLVFIKGKLIGGANEVVKLEEEGKLAVLFEEIPRALSGCECCGGVRFVLCMDCNGSCKVLDAGKKTMSKCGVCNENGLIQCPVCCYLKSKLAS